jgi:L-amino acid N-acyltransferase YncA
MVMHTEASDIAQICRLYEEWTKEKVDFRETETVHNDLRMVMVKDKEKDEIAGAAQLLVIDDAIWNRRWGLVLNLYVGQSFRRKNIGRELMQLLWQEAEFLGCDFISLSTGQEASKQFFKAVGLHEWGTTFCLGKPALPVYE